MMTVKDLRAALAQFDEDEEIFIMGVDLAGDDASELADLAYFFRRNDGRLVLSAIEQSESFDAKKDVRRWNHDRLESLRFVGEGGTLHA